MAGAKNETSVAEALLIDRRGAAHLLGVSPGTIDNLRLRGAIPSIKVLTRRLYAVADLQRFIDSQKSVGGAE